QWPVVWLSKSDIISAILLFCSNSSASTVVTAQIDWSCFGQTFLLFLSHLVYVCSCFSGHQTMIICEMCDEVEVEAPFVCNFYVLKPHCVLFSIRANLSNLFSFSPFSLLRRINTTTSRPTPTRASNCWTSMA